MSDDDAPAAVAEERGVDGGGLDADGGVREAASELVHAVRFGQFVSVGAVGAAIETVVVAALTAGLGAGALAAKAVGAELSISTMFLVNDRWTFAGEGAADAAATVRRWGRSHLVRAVGLSVAFAVLTVLTRFTDVTLVVAGADFWPTVANVVGIAGGMVVNYVAESLFTWDVAGE
ncbi:MAG: GtrA family protein [Halolamina sp.]